MQPGAFQPRREIHREPLEELAASIKANGVIQPIVVRPLPAGSGGGANGAARYEIIAGERRWQAAKLAGLQDIPAIVRELTDQQSMAIGLIENIQREELTAAEEARALKGLSLEFSLTHQQLADTVGRSRAAVSNLIRLLDLPESVVNLIDSKALSMGHARALLGLETAEDQQRIAQQVISHSLSVRDTEKLVRKTLEGEPPAPIRKPPELSVMSEVLRTDTVHVQLHQRKSGAARITVEVNNPQDRDTFIDAIKELARDL
jgi:ParB family chromosome partitioning protein